MTDNGENGQPQAEDLRGVINRVNQLGSATEEMFSRLYRSLNRRSQPQPEPPEAAALSDRNVHLKETLRQREAELLRLHSVLANIDEGVVMQDLDGRVVLINETAKNLLGGQKAFWDSELGQLFINYNQHDGFDTEIADLGEPVRVQVNNMIIGAKIAAVSDGEGYRLGTMILMRDVTRDALSERLKNQFVTAISHELKTPMQVIKSASELLTGQAELPPNRRFLELLNRNVDTLDRMVDELLDVSEMTGGTFEIRKEEVNIEDMICSIVNGLTPDLKKANLDAMVMLRDITSLRVIGDDRRLSWALRHLLRNSINYTEPGGHIIVTADINNTSHIAVQVVDTGVGISEKDMPHVFEQFYRGQPRTTDGRLLDPRGLGQGLFVARQVIEAHGGYISVNSEPGQGSIFTLVLPTHLN